MSGATGMAIDPTLLWQQTRGGMQQQQGESSSKPQDVKQEEQPVQLQEQEQDDTGDAVMEQAASTPSASAAAPTVATNGRLPSPDSKPDIPLPPAIDLQDDAELAAFLAKMEDYEPILPDSVTRFYLEKAGFQSSDDRV